MSTTPEGFYPDPTQGGRARWWDGTEWTDRYQDDGLIGLPPSPARLGQDIVDDSISEETTLRAPTGVPDAEPVITESQTPALKPVAASVTIPRWLLFAIGGGLLLILLIIGAVVAANAISAAQEKAAKEAAEATAAAALEERHETLFNDAIKACDEKNLSYDPEVSDGGKSLNLSGSGGSDFSTFLEFEFQECVLLEIDAPQSVLDRMGQTRALDGTQEAEWDDLIVRWNYHPDNGLGAVVEFTD